MIFSKTGTKEHVVEGRKIELVSNFGHRLWELYARVQSPCLFAFSIEEGLHPSSAFGVKEQVAMLLPNETSLIAIGKGDSFRIETFKGIPRVSCVSMPLTNGKHIKVGSASFSVCAENGQLTISWESTDTKQEFTYHVWRPEGYRRMCGRLQTSPTMVPLVFVPNSRLFLSVATRALSLPESSFFALVQANSTRVVQLRLGKVTVVCTPVPNLNKRKKAYNVTIESTLDPSLYSMYLFVDEQEDEQIAKKFKYSKNWKQYRGMTVNTRLDLPVAKEQIGSKMLHERFCVCIVPNCFLETVGSSIAVEHDGSKFSYPSFLDEKGPLYFVYSNAAGPIPLNPFGQTTCLKGEIVRQGAIARKRKFETI